MNKNISCWECKSYEGFDINDYETSHYCEHDIPNKMCGETGDVHPKTNCVMFERKRKITSDNSSYETTPSATSKSAKADFS